MRAPQFFPPSMRGARAVTEHQPCQWTQTLRGARTTFATLQPSRTNFPAHGMACAMHASRVGIPALHGGHIMASGFGPHDIISLGEIIATLGVLALALVAFAWMAHRNRHHGS